jgi:hypothetical protein
MARLRMDTSLRKASSLTAGASDWQTRRCLSGWLSARRQLVPHRLGSIGIRLPLGHDALQVEPLGRCEHVPPASLNRGHLTTCDSRVLIFLQREQPLVQTFRHPPVSRLSIVSVYVPVVRKEEPICGIAW